MALTDLLSVSSGKRSVANQSVSGTNISPTSSTHRSHRSIVNAHAVQNPHVPHNYRPSDRDELPDYVHVSENRRLTECMAKYDIYENNAEIMHRLQLMAQLNVIFNDWVRQLAYKDESIPNEFVHRISGAIFTFGSFRLGVHTKGADIDTLCVGPRHVSREMFFNEFIQVLSKVPLITNIRKVEEAFVPVIKFKFANVDIDLIYARLDHCSIPADFDICDNSIIKDIDIRCIRSLNGARVAIDLNALVPNHDQYRHALRAIKLWAKHCGVYSNILGYFGGITFAIMMARINQLYPKYLAAQLVHKFFEIFANWEWPNAVMLRPIEEINYGQSVWNPNIRPADRFDLLPVITPSYPQQNSTHNVNESSKKTIVAELKRAYETTDKIMKQEATWDDLFDQPSFLSKFKYFIVVIIRSTEQELLDSLEGLVTSKLRILVALLDHNRKFSRSQIYDKPFNVKPGFKDEDLLSKEYEIDDECENVVQVAKETPPNIVFLNAEDFVVEIKKEQAMDMVEENTVPFSDELSPIKLGTHGGRNNEVCVNQPCSAFTFVQTKWDTREIDGNSAIDDFESVDLDASSDRSDSKPTDNTKTLVNDDKIIELSVAGKGSDGNETPPQTHPPDSCELINEDFQNLKRKLVEREPSDDISDLKKTKNSEEKKEPKPMPFVRAWMIGAELLPETLEPPSQRNSSGASENEDSQPAKASKKKINIQNEVDTFLNQIKRSKIFVDSSEDVYLNCLPLKSKQLSKVVDDKYLKEPVVYRTKNPDNRYETQLSVNHCLDILVKYVDLIYSGDVAVASANDEDVGE